MLSPESLTTWRKGWGQTLDILEGVSCAYLSKFILFRPLKQSYHCFKCLSCLFQPLGLEEILVWLFISPLFPSKKPNSFVVKRPDRWGTFWSCWCHLTWPYCSARQNNYLHLQSFMFQEASGCPILSTLDILFEPLRAKKGCCSQGLPHALSNWSDVSMQNWAQVTLSRAPMMPSKQINVF